MTNWYEKKDMKKYLKKTHNPHLDKHHIKLPFRAAIVGSSGSGKTNTLLTLISMMPDTFEKIWIVTKNKDEPLYNYLYDKTGGPDGMVTIKEFDTDGIPDINKEFNPEQNSLLVFDDLVNQSAKEQRPIADAFIRARKRGCSLIYLSQSFYGIPKLIRNNLTHIFLKQVSSMKNLVMISRECALDMPKKQLIEMYEDATKDKMGFILFDLDGDKDKKFRKNWEEYYELDEPKKN
jgi:ABC-type dipeptide/oligopeptide/nickel transport system ATPase component